MINVVWFKRDLRIHDHRPLFEASKLGEVLPIYIVEPSFWEKEDMSLRHYQFVQESLVELSRELSDVGGKLFVAIAEMEDVLDSIYETLGDFRLLAHEEHGTSVTLFRDNQIRQWMSKRGLSFLEYQNFGVERGPQPRSSFQKNWESFIAQGLVPTPRQLMIPEEIPEILSNSVEKLAKYHIQGEPIRFGQQGGESKALETLESFLENRHKNYNSNLSKPLQSTASCSRLSPYLAWGNISLRYVVTKTREAMEQNIDSKKQLETFLSNLQLHCQLVQKIENEPDIMTKSIKDEYDHIRQNWDEEAFQRWYKGNTGIPLVDAAMRCLHKTGWINYRSRAMVVSFACNTLLLDWRRPAIALAQLFLDYEPGIHYNQIQMQVGTTGTQAIKFLNPVKIGKDEDPEGAFVRRYVTELANIPEKYIHEPWMYPGFYSLNYATPIVDIQKANKKAREVLNSMKKNVETNKLLENQKKSSCNQNEQSSNNQKSNDREFEQLRFDL
ncbi:deoxyribodipyrimidine photo-lyase [Metabacillus crassostreae]|uniref:FAD-binding domain-containing protein n=1 Tax=Metabacillus crassostreae TaxID=929098 RepID=UPI00195C6E6E|nr:FAD-binding domain-containing protein [Metabacillus crassostreae]MBM7604919.1 deoxyribodipyrimidine photo-lyase [Metabacillus crassostreae]